MSEALQRPVIRSFLGLALSGEGASQPVRQLAGEFGAFCADGTVNVHTPAGKLTNRGVGYVQQADKPPNATTWDFLGYMLRNDGNGYQFGISNGKLFDQGQLTNSWTEYTISGLGTGWSGAKLWDWYFLCNGSHDPLVFGGGQEPHDWLIAAPATAPTASGVGSAGSLDASLGWRYKYAYRRSTGFDQGWLSPLSEESDPEITANDLTSVTVTVTGTGDTTIDKIDIFRSDGGGLYRFLATVDNPGDTTTQYSDQTQHADLSIVEATTGSALDPFQFDLITEHGDSVWVAGIVEDGQTRLGRVRKTYPGQPWRFDTFDYTDEIDGPITALVSVDSGVLAFTADRQYHLRSLGGGAIAVDKTDRPGTPNKFTAAEVRGGAAWVSGRNVWLLRGAVGGIISDPTGRSVFTQEQVAGSSIEPVLRDLANLSSVWINYHHGLNYVVLGTGPSEFYAYDLERSAWWKFGYGATRVARVASVAADRELSEIVFARTDGTIARMFNGRTAGGDDLRAVGRVGPTSMFSGNKNDWKRVRYDYDVETDLDIVARWEINSGAIASSSTVISAEATGATLDTTFILDESKMGLEARVNAKHCINKKGEYLTFELATRGQGLLELAAAVPEFQVVP